MPEPQREILRFQQKRKEKKNSPEYSMNYNAFDRKYMNLYVRHRVWVWNRISCRHKFNVRYDIFSGYFCNMCTIPTLNVRHRPHCECNERQKKNNNFMTYRKCNAHRKILKKKNSRTRPEYMQRRRVSNKR